MKCMPPIPIPIPVPMPGLAALSFVWMLALPLLVAAPAHAQSQPQSQSQAQAQAPVPLQAQDRDTLVLIGHANVPRLDLPTAQRLYTGRAVEVGGIGVVVVNAAPGSRLRERFMAGVMAQDDDKYVAYWTVRKHIGKGTPPREFKSATEVIEFVQNTPGGVGYIGSADLKPGMNVVLRP